MEKSSKSTKQNGERRGGERMATFPRQQFQVHRINRERNLRSSILIFLQLVGPLTCSSVMPSYYFSDCAKPLGMANGRVQDWQLAASLTKSRTEDPQCAVKYARLHASGGKAWCAAKASKNQWLLVDLGVVSTISGVVTQGRGNVNEWVTRFMISYSLDAGDWEYARDIYGNKKSFKGNGDSHRLKHSYLEHPVNARFVRIHVLAWHAHPSLRLELIGCQECNEIVSIVPYTELSASSHRRWRRRKSCQPDMGDLNSAKGWCPTKQSGNEWLQFDLGPPTTVTGLITRGQGDRKRYVTSYSMSYSNDSSTWFFYRDANHLDAKIFGGNMDRFTERKHYLNEPVTARYVRFNPVTWRRRIGLRAGILGCRHKGECGAGFMKVNSGSSCVANKAYNRSTWIEDRRHTWQGWRYGHSSLAVDGNTDASFSNCAIMDNHYVDQPIWMVDLGKESTVNGAIVHTWQGAGQDGITSYTDYVYNLEKMTVYVSNKKHSGAGRLARSSKCSTITRLNNALFNPRLHFECPEQLKGRYLYLKAVGVPDRWRKTFTVVLCEVMVY